MFYIFCFFFYGYGAHRDLHVLTHSFPTRRSSDLAQPRDDRRVGRSRDRREARVGFEAVEAEGHGTQRIEGGRQVGKDEGDHALDQIALDRRVGPALDTHRPRSAAAADDRKSTSMNSRPYCTHSLPSHAYKKK